MRSQSMIPLCMSTAEILLSATVSFPLRVGVRVEKHVPSGENVPVYFPNVKLSTALH